MMQTTTLPLDVQALVRAEVPDVASAEVILSVSELLSAMQRSRMLHQAGAPATGVIIQIAKHGAMRPTTLAAVHHVDVSTMSRQLAKLESDGLVIRVEDSDDRRSHLVDLTPLGHEHARESLILRIQSFQRFIREWPETDRTEFARLLGRFVDDFERYLSERNGAS